MKRWNELKIALAGTVLMLSMSVSAYADGWVSSGSDWYYERGGQWAVNEWVQDNGAYYYLGSDGRMLRNTMTPDGYQVGADGAWIQGNSTSQSGAAEGRLNYAMAAAGLSKHSYYKNLSASQIAEAEAVAQEIAKAVLSDPSLKTDLDKVSAAGWLIYYNFILPGNYGNDANKYYRSPYGVFITGNNTCAGGTRALGRVLDYMGYEWSHANENQWTHQWCVLMMDGQQGYGDSMGYGSGYGTHPYAR